jgi:hypothetical protein
MHGGDWTIEMYVDSAGRCPVRDWLDDLPAPSRAAVLALVDVALRVHGNDVCNTEYGKNLGAGLYEGRIRQDAATIYRKAGRDVPASLKDGADKVLLRVFFHVYGDRVVLLLSGYDKLADTKGRRQDKEIKSARRHLRSFQLEAKRADKARRR